jgi:hypothetical protein
LAAAAVAGTTSDPLAVGTKLTVQASVSPGATSPTGEHTAAGVPGSPLVLIAQLASIAVAVPAFSHTAVHTTGAPTTPGVGEQLTVLTMSGVPGATTGGATATEVVPALFPVAPAGSLPAAVALSTTTGPDAGAGNSTLQPSDAPAATSTGTLAFGHTTLAPAGSDPALLTWQVAPVAVAAPTFVHVTAHATSEPATAGFGVHATVLTMSGCAVTTTVATAVSHAVGVTVEQIWYGTV